MDEMKLQLCTLFMRNLVSKWIITAIKKKLGYDVDIQLNHLDINLVDGELRISTNVEAKIKNDDLIDILKEKDIG